MKVAIIGGRGNGTVIASTIEDCNSVGEDIECIGFINDNESEINGYPVLGGIQNFDIDDYGDDVQFIYALSNVKMAEARHQILKNLPIPRDRYCNVIHPTAVVSGQARLGVGVALMPYVVVSPNASIGDHSQMYAQSFIGHDSSLKEMIFVANNASIGGRIVVEDGAHIGSNSSLRERIAVGEYSVIGLASNVLNDVNAYDIVAGNPAKKIKSLKDE